MRRSNPTIILSLLLVFVSGLAVGAFGYHYLRSVSSVSASPAARTTPDAWRKQYMQEMETRVKLGPEQSKQLNGILDETRSRFHDARAAHDRLMKTIKEEQTNKVRSMLTSEQRVEFEKLRAERELRAKASGK